LNKPAFPVESELNVLGEPLQPCSTNPMTGFFRNGGCLTGPDDVGRHVVCAEMTDAFLAFSKSAGNDLSTPMPQFAFPGLRAGDRWCLVAMRWQEALDAGMAPRVALLSTHHSALKYVKLEDLKRYALDLT
jgi:uncharacterized protein (DUF2237 family)